MIRKTLISIFLILLIAVGWQGFKIYRYLYLSKIEVDESNDGFFYVNTQDDFALVKAKLIKKGIVTNEAAFDWIAEKKKYPQLIKPGRYQLKPNMTYVSLIDLLRSGEQTPLQFTFNNLRTFEQLAALAAQKFEADSMAFLSVFKNKEIQQRYGFNSHTFKAMFIPNTYEFYWNTAPQEFIERMAKEFKLFWNDERLGKAKQQKLTQSEVYILSSIVQSETAKADELPTVAGLYLNRLRVGMPLQADPTVVYAVGDFSIKRVLNEHKGIDSPYNTYKYKGLPPGPIRFADIKAIEAVLNAPKVNYLYMCAKDDFSGYHHFSANYQQHLIYARTYQKALNERKIFR